MENRVKKAATNPQITVVTGTLNRPHVVLYLIKQLEDISKTLSVEVIVVDQSLPENWQHLQEQFPRLDNFTLFHFDTPNTCKYLNYGWKNANSALVLYLDDDVTITDRTIQAHIDAYSDPTIQAVAGRVLNDGEQATKDKRVGKIMWYGAEFTKNFSFDHKTFADFPYGCNMSFRKDALKEMGGFDEKLSPPIYAFNEVDLGYRITKKWKNSLVFSPEALVYHHQYKRGGTRNDFEIQNVFQSNNFNYGYFLGKNFSWIENAIYFFRRFPYQIIREPNAIPYIVRGFISSHATKEVSNKKKEE